MSAGLLYRAVLITTCLTILPVLTSGREPCHVGKSGSLAGQAAKDFYGDKCDASHNTGKLVVRIWDARGFGGTNYYNLPDCATGETPFFWGAEYPKKSRICYLSSASISVGGILNGDTLVSQFYEWSSLPPEGYWEFRSILDPSAPEYEGAVSQQDFITKSTDTVTVGLPNLVDYPGPHRPLFLELTRRSYSWSYSYAEDFVLFYLSIKNIGSARISDAYVAFHAWPDVGFKGGTRITDIDDLGGFVKTVPAAGPCGLVDTVNIMWWADNDGDPVDGVFTDRKVVSPEGDVIKSCPDVTGIYVIQPPLVAGSEEWGKTTLSYNWWYST